MVKHQKSDEYANRPIRCRLRGVLCYQTTKIRLAAYESTHLLRLTNCRFGFVEPDDSDLEHDSSLP